jgi:hypothetical protein
MALKNCDVIVAGFQLFACQRLNETGAATG